ncbi:Type 4 prepilin-like proteins leader peptide-processing enzyme [Fructobacillus sp. EFB-N1]|nr:Type 4 prepilin-like proteins leader peptide-processing enzyme [Fructobacillus sp. EFB-N1]
MTNILLYLTNLIIVSLIFCLADRSSQHLFLWTKRSFCFSCHHILFWYDLIPVFSAWFLKGRCRYCKQPFANWPLLAILEGILPLFLTALFHQNNLWVLGSAYLLLYLAKEDWSTMTCSAWLAWLWVAVLISFVHHPYSGWFLTALILLVLWLTLNDFLGIGDIPVLAIGFFSLTEQAFSLFLLLSSTSVLIYLAFQQENQQRCLPFIPFLFVGFVLAGLLNPLLT